MAQLKRVSPAIIIGAVVVLVVAAAAALILSRFQPATALYLGNGIFDAQVVSTPEAREKGLGGVESLTPKQAMIFAYPSDDAWKIWMKDMKFSIDIVWLDKDKKVVYVVKGASPDDSTSVIYTPKTTARYVVELPAGSVDTHTIQISQVAIFDSSSIKAE